MSAVPYSKYGKKDSWISSLLDNTVLSNKSSIAGGPYQVLPNCSRACMYICVDFDGTVVDHRYPDIGEPVPGALDWLKRYQRYGARLILFTMRSDRPGREYLSESVEFLKENGIRLYGINHNPDQDSWTDSPKAYAEVYIDDAAFGCPLIHPRGFARPCVNWKKVGPKIERMLLGR